MTEVGWTTLEPIGKLSATLQLYASSLMTEEVTAQQAQRTSSVRYGLVTCWRVTPLRRTR